ncbi:MAG: ABC transporter substrate-binding protein [Coriobacteriales bacterium]|nr:ABC transporter substrate-binding protein [Coriobacteriales bacterium]
MAASTLSRRSFVGLAGATAATALLARFGIVGDIEFANADETTFTYAIAGDPGSNVNPVTTSDRFGLMTLKLLFAQLFTYRADGVHFYLATGYDESEDHLEFTFHLREGVTWSDGEPVTADDVVFSYETIRETPVADAYSSLNYGDQGKVLVEAIDDLTVKFTFPFVIAAALEQLQGPDGVYIFPRHIYEGIEDYENTDVNKNPVGCGAYILDDYQAGSYIAFRANENYFDGVPGPSYVVYQIITNENSGMQAIQTGAVDAWIATAAQVQQMQIEANGLTVNPYTEGRVAYIVINTKLVPDINVRKALFYSLDREQIALAAVLDPNYYDVEYTFLPTNSAYYNADAVEKYERNIDKAKELLAEAGQPNPTFVFGYSGTDSLQTNAALMIQRNAKEAGINIELRGVESSALSKAMKNADDKEYHITFGGYIMGIDPDSYTPLFASGSPSNYAHYDNAVLDDLFAQGRIETDIEKRHEIYDAVQAEIADQATHYQLYSNHRLLITGPRVKGLEDAKLIPIFTFEDVNKLQIG